VNNTKSKQLSHDSTLRTQLFTTATSLGLATYICNRFHLGDLIPAQGLQKQIDMKMYAEQKHSKGQRVPKGVV
jgi:hypothetical protein